LGHFFILRFYLLYCHICCSAYLSILLEANRTRYKAALGHKKLEVSLHFPLGNPKALQEGDYIFYLFSECMFYTTDMQNRSARFYACVQVWTQWCPKLARQIKSIMGHMSFYLIVSWRPSSNVLISKLTLSIALQKIPNLEPIFSPTYKP